MRCHSGATLTSAPPHPTPQRRGERMATTPSTRVGSAGAARRGGAAALRGGTRRIRGDSLPSATNPALDTPGRRRQKSPIAASSAYDRLIERLATLPGLGKRSAERIALHLLRQPPEDTAALADAVSDFRLKLKVCSVCGHVTESDPCPICSDPQRDRMTILVVEQPADVVTLEQSGAYRGLYHVLMGRLAPLEAIGPGELNIAPLLQRLGPAGEGGQGPPVREVVLGTNPTLEGDGTALYLSELLEGRGVRVTRLARGLPSGTSLERLSKAVLRDAVQSRRSMDGR